MLGRVTSFIAVIFYLTIKILDYAEDHYTMVQGYIMSDIVTNH